MAQRIYVGSTKINKNYLGNNVISQTITPNKWYTPSYAYYNIVDTQSYTSGSSTLFDLSPAKSNASIVNTSGTNVVYGVSGSIPFIRNNNGINYATNSPRIAGGDYSTTGLTHNIWVKPFDDFFPYESKKIFQIRFAQAGHFWGVGMEKNGTGGGWFYQVSLVNNTSETSPETYSYIIPNAGFLDNYHLFSYVWDSGNNITMYFDGVQVLTDTTTKSWSGDSGAGSGGCNLFSASNQISGEEFIGYWGSMAFYKEKWDSTKMLEYYNDTKGNFGR